MFINGFVPVAHISCICNYIFIKSRNFLVLYYQPYAFFFCFYFYIGIISALFFLVFFCKICKRKKVVVYYILYLYK